jgi:hypothetical protein
MNFLNNVHKKSEKFIKNMVHFNSQQTFSTNGSNPNKMINVLFIMVSGMMVRNVVEENKSGEMVQFMKESFKMIWPMVVVV